LARRLSMTLLPGSKSAQHLRGLACDPQSDLWFFSIYDGAGHFREMALSRPAAVG